MIPMHNLKHLLLLISHMEVFILIGLPHLSSMINHPAIGVPPFQEIPILCRSSRWAYPGMHVGKIPALVGQKSKTHHSYRSKKQNHHLLLVLAPCFLLTQSTTYDSEGTVEGVFCFQ